MRSNSIKSHLIQGLASSVLLLASGVGLAQQQVNLTAGPATANLPDGSTVPMWGYNCGSVVSGSMATCAALNPNAGLGWSPVVITVPTGQSLQINLTNNLSFTTSGATTFVPTSLTIVGQLGGGLGDAKQRTTTASPEHIAQGVTWSVPNTGANFSPPPQLARVQSFATEVTVSGGTTALTWSNLRPGTYLIESGTHPSIQGPMGLYGVLVVTTAPNTAGTPPSTGCAYPDPKNPANCLTAAAYNAEVPLLMSEIDPVQNAEVDAAVRTAGFSETAPWHAMQNQLSAVLITAAGSGYAATDAVKFSGGGCQAWPTASLSVDTTGSITGVKGAITGVNILTPGSNCSFPPQISIGPTLGSGAVLTPSMAVNMFAACGADAVTKAAAGACYPPAVNYTPLYYLFNGVAFDKTHSSASLFAATAGVAGTPPVPVTVGLSGNLLVRLVNAGLRMHVPSIVGSSAVCNTAPCPGGFTLVAEDGNPVPPTAPRIQSEVFMSAGKTFDVMVATPTAALPIYDRELSLSGNAVNRDAGMLAYIGANGATTPAASSTGVATANPDTYNSVITGQTLTVSDPSRGIIANDVNVYGVKIVVGGVAQTGPVVGTNGTLTLNENGTFTYVANAGPQPAGGTQLDQFTYCGNGTLSGTACTTVTLKAVATESASAISCAAPSFSSNLATYLAIKPPGILASCTDGLGFPLTVAGASTGSPLTVALTGPGAGSAVVDANGGFTATVSAPGTYTFAFNAQSSQGVQGGCTPTPCSVTATVNFQAGSGLKVTVVDGTTGQALTGGLNNMGDYRWVIEEDRTFYINPNCVQNPPPAGCPTSAGGIVPTLGVNFHTSSMPYVAQGCTGLLSCESGQTQLGKPVVCDVGNGACRPDTGDGITTGGSTWVSPSQVHLDPTKRYYISVLPGDGANPFIAGYAGAPDCVNAVCGHGMGGAPIGIDPNTGVQQKAVTVVSQPSPYPPSELSVFVFEDDFPLNGEHDGGGGVDVIAPNEPGLGGFEIILWDAMGGNGDFTGQMTHDMFNQPLSNSLAGTIDPITGLDSCPIATQVTSNVLTGDGSQQGITGRIVTCPKYESDGATLSPLAGQAVVKNLMPMRVGVVANPGADRIARGEEWLQTNTLDGQKAHDAFFRVGEPSYFQEFGPASYHVTIGFANPAIINARRPFVCNGTDPNLSATNCKNTLSGMVTGQRLSRTPDERLYSSGTHDAFYWTQCYVSVGDPDGEDFAFTKCNADGSFTLTGLPDGDWRVTTFDQWNDQLVDGLSTPVRLGGTSCAVSNTLGCNPSSTPSNVYMEIAATQWQTNLYTKTFVDDNGDGIAQAAETGIPFANVAVRLRDGSLENLLVTDFTGTANFNETFPLFGWYVVETDVTRYKNTGTHVVYDVGGPADGSSACGTAGYPPCGTPAPVISKNLANTAEQISVPLALRVPGAIYCADADCTGKSMLAKSSSAPPSVCTSNSTGATTCSTQLSSGRIDPPWVGNEGWQGFPGQNNFLEFGKAPYDAGENGGIKGHVIYASTRPFDDPQMLVQTQWEPLVAHVGINLYKEGFAADGVTPTLTLVDTTYTTSFDDFAQGFRRNANGQIILNADGSGIPNMNCPGQGSTSSSAIPDLFFFSLYNQPQYLDLYNQEHATPGVLNTAATGTPLPNNSQFKCYDGMHNWNQLQPVPYDGQYKFPSVVAKVGNSGLLPAGQPGTDWILELDPTSYKTNCTICTPNPVDSTPMLPPGKYVVEVVLPPGYELVKEEDKNILIGDNYIAPVTQEFGGLGNIFIIPDQASIAGTFSAGSGYNAYNLQNPTQNLGAAPNNSIVPAFIPEPTWPCVGELRTVPDYISLFPQSTQVSPFAGASRHLCDRKEVTLGDQMGAIAKFYVFTSTHIAAKFTGGITDDYTSEFDPFSPQFGEKFAPPDLPVSLKDWTGTEIGRVYADHWGAYNGMVYSTWEVNPPNPTGYAPNMMVFCMNDPGPITDTRPTVNGLANPTLGKQITDPLFSEGYSQFCYELPFMPGTTQYLDTPVVPTSAFAGAGYNNVDCAEPDATPLISEVDGDVIGPWVSATGHKITITALGNTPVPNYAYTGPSATTAPFNQKTVNRHYGFGTQKGTNQCLPGESCVALIGADGNQYRLTGVTWSDNTITGNVPGTLPNCAMQQSSMYRNRPSSSGTPPFGNAKCGQLVITTANTAATGQPSNAKQSIDAITVTVGGRPPTHVTAAQSIQTAIDTAAPGDLIIVDPAAQASGGNPASTAAHNELVVMWKPVRLQGVGASASVINANTHPAGKLTPWRQQIACLFGLGMDGTPGSFDPACGAGWSYFHPTNTTGQPCAAGICENPQVDRISYEAVVGWDASGNGNLAQLLQEPTLMGALEGAGITVVAKGVYFPSNPFDPSLSIGFPTGTVLFTSSDTNTRLWGGRRNPGDTPCDGTYPSNFQCNPSSIDGLGITNSSQGGGGIFVHAWGHNLQIANNRVYNNAGTLSGGINLGLGEYPPQNTAPNSGNLPPGSCEDSGVDGLQLPYCLDTNVNMHHNYVSLNSSTGDELFSATPAGAGGVSLCTGSDYYKFNYNWVCGNLSNGDGGGVGHLGFSKNGDIEHNTIIFNQSTNPTIPTNGGGLVVMGTPDVDPTCGVNTDQDCVSPLGQTAPSDGVGPGLVINANLIMGNAAESGSGGGIAVQNANGTDVITFPDNPNHWNQIEITNNIIANNVAGWDGGGISLLDALKTDIVNNTIVSNVTTASAGVLNNTLGAPLASTQNCPPGHIDPITGVCNQPVLTSTPQPAGIVSLNNSAILVANFPGTGVTCPGGYVAPGTGRANGTCTHISYPQLRNNVIWDNSPYYISVGGTGATTAQYQQNMVTLLNAFTHSVAASQTATGQCMTTGANATQYWDIGVRGDTNPSSHTSGYKLNPVYSLLTDAGDYTGQNNLGGNPQVVAQYCDGSRQPPEACASASGGTTGGCGWAVPPGISDATVPNPIFNLTPVATVDEGNNWINMRWGPLSLTNPAVKGADGNFGGGAALGNYSLQSTSPAIDAIPVGSAGDFPTKDFFGNPRPDPANPTHIDVGAVEH